MRSRHFVSNSNLGSPSDVSIAHLMYGSSVSHWNEPLQTTLEVYEKSYTIGVESGNFQYACYGLAHSAYTEFFCGFISLSRQRHALEKYSEFVVRTGNKWAADVIRGIQFVIDLLTCDYIDITRAKEGFEELIEEFRGHQSRQPICILYVILEYSSLFGSLNFPCVMEEARREIITVAPQFLMPYVMFQFLDLLTSIERASDRRDVTEVVEKLANFRKLAEVGRESVFRFLCNFFFIFYISLQILPFFSDFSKSSFSYFSYLKVGNQTYMAHCLLIEAAVVTLTDSNSENVIANYARVIEACAKLENYPLEGGGLCFVFLEMCDLQ